MIKLGLTGGIGSGKSTVARIFESFGVPVYYADDRAKSIMNQNPVVKKTITETFGKDSYIQGKLNRKYIGSIVFGNNESLKQLNHIVHPAVAEDFKNWCSCQTSTLIVKEAAVLIESGGMETVDKVVVVKAHVKTRIKRVMERDGVKEEDVIARLNHQMTDSQRLKYADYLIDNGGKQMLIPQVRLILQDLKFIK